MIKIICELCNLELNDLGAILFSPPTEHRVRKIHICRDCYHSICKLFKINKIENKDLNQTTCCKEEKPLSERTFC